MATPKKIKAIVTKCQIIDNRIMLLEMKPLKRVPNFTPGQFLHMALGEYDPSGPWPESRVFSIASSPEMRQDRINLLISKQGKFTRRIFNEITVGKELWIKLPYGDFTLNNRLEEPNIFIAGGTGISPFLSILKNNFIDYRSIELYYGIRSIDYFIDKNFLIHKCETDLKFEMEVFIENEDLNHFRMGLIDIKYIYNQHKNEQCNYFLSGPKKMIDIFSNYLMSKGVPEKRVIIDSWE